MVNGRDPGRDPGRSRPAGAVAVWVFLTTTCLAHPLTRAAHEAALDPKETLRLAAATGLRSAGTEAGRVAEWTTVSICLVDADTWQPVDGLLRVARENGAVVPLPGLVNRGIRLRANHPAKDWFALLGSAAVSIPRERLTFEAFSGLNTEVARLTVDLSASAPARIEIPLKSFADSARGGWIAGNTHLHLNTLTREQSDEYLRVLPRADRLEVVFVSHLERIKADATYITNSYSRAELEALGGPRLRFGNGEEHRHNFERNTQGYGHVMFLNVRDLIRPVSIGSVITGSGPDWPPLQPGIEQARGQGATIVWCHNAFGLEDVPGWLRGAIEAQNIFDGGSQGSYAETFYRFLDVGLKVPFSTGTDWFIYDFSRVYVRMSSAPDVENWLAALKAGRSYITNGPLLDLRVGGREMGEMLTLASTSKVPVTGRAAGRHDFGGIELVHDAHVVHRAAARAVGGHFEAQLEFELQVEESGWVALRIPSGSTDSAEAVVMPPSIPVRGTGTKNEMGEVLFAHTSPVYLEVAGRDIFRPEAARALIMDMESAMKEIQAKGRFDADGQREEVLQVYRAGIRGLRQRLADGLRR